MNKKNISSDIKYLISHPENWRVISIFDPPGDCDHADACKKEFQSHHMREIMLALSGEYTYGFNGTYYSCRPGTLFLIDSGIKHELCYTDEAENLLHLWTYELDNLIPVRILAINRSKINMLASALIIQGRQFDINEMWDAFNCAENEAEREIRKQYLKLTLALSFATCFNASQPNRDSFQLTQIKMAVMRIRNNLKNGVSVDHLAKVTGYSRFHFVRLFKQYTGGTIQEYLDQCRRQEYFQLKKQRRPQKEIAAELGFKDVHSFYRWVKKKL